MPLTCKSTTTLVSQSMDRKLSLRERWALGLHLIECDGCRKFMRQYTLIRRGVRQLAQDDDTSHPPKHD